MYKNKKIIATLLVATVIIHSALVDLVVAQTTLVAPVRETIFVSDPAQKQELPESTDSIYYSQKKLDFDAKQALETIRWLSKWIEEIMTQVDELDKEFDSSNIKYQQTKKEIFDVVQDLDDARAELDSSIKKIGYYQDQVVKSAGEIENIRKEMEETKEYMQRFTQFLYKFQNELISYEGESTEIDEIKLFLNTETHIANKLSDSYLIEAMIMKLEELMSALQEEEKKQIDNVRLSNQNKRKAKDTIDHYQKSVEDLNQKRLYLLDFLTLYKSNSEKIEGTIQTLFDTRMEAHTDIIENIQEIKEEKYNVSFDINKQIIALNSIKDYAPKSNDIPFDWPLYPVSNISNFFMDQEYKKEYWVDHIGIEIPAQQRTPLYATRNAIVYKIADNGDGFGLNWMLLMHDNDYVTVYKYPNELLVKEWDIVRRWQLIGYSGWEPGTKWAGFISKWPNLTFAIAKDGEFIDPLTVLDLSVIQNKSILSKVDKIKYLKDLYARPRDLYKLTFFEGRSQDERRENFLDTYGVWIYGDTSFWEDAADWTNIDLDVWICVAFAESTLWLHLSTSNNIGNVGNNDRGDRIAYQSPLAWARLIYETMNNGYLGHYNTILELNGYGNEDGKMYATSEYNWQNNVTKCLSMIKWFYVPDNFPFRVAPNPERINITTIENKSE